ncbi:MAG: FxDxF family PEP-CTERM protein [Nitrosomonas sp.]|uniref:FxDxF family PEP-CTERM protein n=1 Tax=Nitrosomonas sp. TaxID=42353 RepID=UPI001D91BC05|nr:FxDxF family PEP-CTERM protein [Nitrosomonas sp.]MBX9894377.1 FxDxF family PEP-CTERM protein [Nitrosomonas sp.]
MKRLLPIALGSLITAFASTSAFAVPVSWTDWTSSTNSSSASGSLSVGSDTVGVEYSATSAHGFVTTGVGTNYWTGSAYTNGTVDNAPPASDIIALTLGGTVTITFSQTVIDPYIALASWNFNTVDFGVPIVIDSFGPGFWGSGTPVLNASGTGFFGSGEVHGVIRLPGSFDSISFTHTSETWHGFTVGVAGIAPVPEPETYAMLLVGLGLLGFAARRRQQAA